MFESGRSKERERYYLLPGMGGRAAKRKHTVMLWFALAAGVLVSIVLATILYFFNYDWH